MRLYQSEVCQCKGKTYSPGRKYGGLLVCGNCGCLRADESTEIVVSAKPTWRDAVHEDDDGRSTPSVERGARQSRFHGRVNITMRQYLAGMEE